MYWVRLRDGSRKAVEAENQTEAAREAIRLGALSLEQADAPAPLSRDDLLAALGLARPGLFAVWSPGWLPPAGGEVRELLKVGQLTASTAARLVGVPNRKLRSWAADDGSMPYAVWRLLAIYARLAEPERLTVKN